MKKSKALAAIIDPIAGAPNNMGAPEFLRWWAHRLIQVYGENPRAAYMRAFHELANRMEDAAAVSSPTRPEKKDESASKEVADEVQD